MGFYWMLIGENNTSLRPKFIEKKNGLDVFIIKILIIVDNYV